jgi:hypothetical protein
VQGNSIEDSYFAVKSGSCLIKTVNTDRNWRVTGSYLQMYRAFDELEQMVNLVAIDSKFDFGK